MTGNLLADIQARYSLELQRPIIAAILKRLREELPKKYRYHSVEHSENVLFDVLHLGMLAGLANADLELLAIAAAFHDSGFLFGPTQHEQRGAELATTAMLEHGYGEVARELVASMIRDTQVNADGSVQAPATALSSYLLDADLSNFGRDNFFEEFSKIRYELGKDGNQEFIGETCELLERHRWQTSVAQTLLQQTKEKNLLLIRNLKNKNEDIA